MQNRATGASFKFVALVGMLLLAQTITSTHFDFDDTHAIDEICAICVAISGLAVGNLADLPSLEASLGSSLSMDFFAREPARIGRGRPLARGPPQAS